MSEQRYIAYYRVSTQRQGKSGLGLDAQRKAVNDRLANYGYLVAEYTEVESARKSNRPKLAQALSACRFHKATLIIAKLDRLARNVAFVSNLMEAGVEFEAVDFPHANRLTIHILAAVAEHEATLISERTRLALASAKGRGIKLGGFRGRPGTKDDCAAARLARGALARQRASDAFPLIEALQNDGVTSLRGIARALSATDLPTGARKMWHASQVRRCIQLARGAPS